MRLSNFRPSASMAVAATALVVAGAGVGTAASGLISGSRIKPGSITGTQIKNHSVGLNKLSGRLPAGPRGPQGIPGPGGSSLGLVESVDAPPTTGTLATEVTLATLHSIPAGSYILTGKLALSGGTLPVLAHCFLRAGSDVDETDVFVVALTGNDALSFILPHTFTATGTATLSCNSSGISLGTQNAKIGALQVRSLSVNPT